MKNISLLFNGYMIGLLTGCLTTNSTSEYCVTVGEDEDCPSLSAVNETVFPVDTCSGTHLAATEYTKRQDSISVWEEDIDSDAQFDSCCYATDHSAPLGVTCSE